MSTMKSIREAYHAEMRRAENVGVDADIAWKPVVRATFVDSIMVALADAGTHVTTVEVAGALDVSVNAVNLMRGLARSNPAMFERVRNGTAPSSRLEWFARPPVPRRETGEAKQQTVASVERRRSRGEIRRGDRVTILRRNRTTNRFEREGEATVLAATQWKHQFLVRFLGSDEIVLRHVDPAVQFVGVERYLAASNSALDELSA